MKKFWLLFVVGAALAYWLGTKRLLIEKVYDDAGNTVIWQKDRFTGKRYIMFKGTESAPKKT